MNRKEKWKYSSWIICLKKELLNGDNAWICGLIMFITLLGEIATSNWILFFLKNSFSAVSINHRIFSFTESYSRMKKRTLLGFILDIFISSSKVLDVDYNVDCMRFYKINFPLCVHRIFSQTHFIQNFYQAPNKKFS